MIGALARNSLLTSIVLGLRLVTQAATLVLLTRLLQPSIYGHFAAVASLAVVLGMLSSLGSGYVLMAQASGQLAVASDIWRYAWPLALGLGALLGICYLPLAHWLAEGSIPWSVLGLIAITELLVTPLTGLASFALQTSERVPLSQWLQWLPLGLRVLATLPCFALPLDWRLPAYAILQCVVGLFGVIVSCRIAQRHLHLDWHPRRPTTAELKQGSSYAAMLVVAANPSELDKMLAVREIGATDAGVYTAASRVMGALVTPVLAMLLSAQPRLFRHARTGQTAYRLHVWLSAAALVWGLLSGLALALASPWLPVIFGAAYGDTAQLLPWMAITAPLLALRLSFGSILVASGHPLQRIAFEAAGIACLLIAILLLTPSHGSRGMVFAVIIAETVMCLLGFWMVFRPKKLSNQTAA